MSIISIYYNNICEVIVYYYKIFEAVNFFFIATIYIYIYILLHQNLLKYLEYVW